MHRININIALLFITVALFSQKNSNIRITYDVGLKLYKSGESLTKEKKSYNDFMKDLPNKTYILDINNEHSIFYTDNKMNIDVKNKLDLVSAFVGNGVYYHNAETNITLNQKNTLGEDFIIENEVKYIWNLSQEKKKIGDYICFKATTTQKYINRIGETKTKQIVAWYNPDIPINIGIKDYHGLPGIIISLDEGDVYYECVKIELNLTENLNLSKPYKGKYVTKKEYNDILKTGFTKKFGIKNR
ncbi:GLPGLI family protein [Polaribacter vadi]|uniref:GLPGLI family protein n=1 Tax=Polaribacter TaxID=52959 RepID=UPI001C0A4C58|nr:MULTISPECIES: GLPGLI family protein [Polaribacter]MBU3011222.1 GLPGLI family protein [Polaribacter vadi]MDO6741035.1 GLPGLI family protein [Polaribacter sp. 1_MG-2023]